MVYAKTGIVAPFLIHTVSPRVLISPDSTKTVSDMQLNGSVIAVEESEAAVDPLELFDEVFYNIEINACNI